MTVLRDFRAEQEDLSWMDEGVCAQVGDDLFSGSQEAAA